MAASRSLSLFLFSKFNRFHKTSPISARFLCSSSPATPYPLYYELISSRPPRTPRLSARKSRKSDEQNPLASSLSNPISDTHFEDWADSKISEKCANSDTHFEDWADGKVSDKPSNPDAHFEDWVDSKISEKPSNSEVMDKSKRKYYSKRRKRMYGSDSDDDPRGQEDKYIELKPEVVDLPTFHAREEELYFYDTFAFPWEKEKHYKMVYQLEKKYFPDQCLDKAFVDPGVEQRPDKGRKKKSWEGEKKEGDDDGDKRLVFFEKEKKDLDQKVSSTNGNVGVITEKKVEEFFKCLKKVPNVGEAGASGEPYFASRRTGLPPKWDGPCGTVVLVNKPKGWTSFTVCGKLRRLVKVQKVGHAGTLDPMATGLLIVCVGKATKLVDRYQGMIKGYSGVFRLGEATSTWDADSPVIQREPWEHIKDNDIKKSAASFCGEIWQVPPMFSAIKVGGEKMYEKARRGEMVELSPRRISIYQFDIERSLNDRQNLIFRVTCSKGTYIRSLCADFGKVLGSCAHLTALRRDSIGEYSADDAWDFQELQEQVTKGYL